MKLPIIIATTAAVLMPALAPAAITYISGATGNGNFETIIGAVGSKPNFSSGNVPSWTNWGAYDSADSDTGNQPGADRHAYLQNDGAGTNGGPGVGTGGAIRSTITTATGEGSAAGTIFTYGFLNDSANAARGTSSMVLIYDNGGVWTEIAGSFLRGGPDASAAFAGEQTYSRSFTVNAGDAWANQAITVAFRHALASDDTGVLGDAVNGSEQYPEIDDVVFSSVPEPSAALLGVLGVLLGVRRRRH